MRSLKWHGFRFYLEGQEASSEVRAPEGMSISPSPIKSLQRNIAGDYKKSVLKTDCPKIKINSSFLTLPQRNQFASLMGVSDTFLSFICRNDWQQVNDLGSIIDVNHIQLNNNSALKLSQTYVLNGLASVITITTPFTIAVNPAYGLGPYGAGPYGIGSGGYTFDPGAITYNDLTMIITTTNPLPSLNLSVFITYTYPGWLVEPESMDIKYKGGWIDRGTLRYLFNGV